MRPRTLILPLSAMFFAATLSFSFASTPVYAQSKVAKEKPAKLTFKEKIRRSAVKRQMKQLGFSVVSVEKKSGDKWEVQVEKFSAKKARRSLRGKIGPAKMKTKHKAGDPAKVTKGVAQKPGNMKMQGGGFHAGGSNAMSGGAMD